MRGEASRRLPWTSLTALMLLMILSLVVARWQVGRLARSLTAPRFQISAWVPHWDRARVRASFAAHVADLNEANFFWYEVQPDGSLVVFPGPEDATLLALARDQNLRVLPTITNDSDGSRVTALLADEETRTTHIRTLVQLVERMDYDGLDLDYEALPVEARDDFSVFVEALAEALHKRGKLLSIAVHAKTNDRGTWDGPRAQDWTRLGAAVDEFKVMAYNYHWKGSDPGPIAPLTWIDAVLTYAEKTVPAGKIWLGLPFYGYDWGEQKGRGLVWATADALMQRHRPSTQRDDSSGELFFYYTTDGVQHTVYIPDARAVAIKVRLACRQHPNIAGVSIWRLGGESAQHWTALRKAQRGCR